MKGDLRLLRMNQNTTKAKIAKAATLPTTPPAIAPTFERLLSPEFSSGVPELPSEPFALRLEVGSGAESEPEPEGSALPGRVMSPGTTRK